MNLICPHCQKQLTLADEHAGQILKCPHCSAMFMAPALPTVDVPGGAPAAPAPPPAPPSEPGPAPVWSGIGQVKAGPSEAAPEMQAAPPPLEKEPEILPPGELTRIFSVRFNPYFLAWCGPVGLVLIFILSFFPWSIGTRSGNLWTLAFASSSAVRPVFASYVMFTFFLALPLAVVSFLIGKKLIPLPPPLKKLRTWRALIVAGITASAFLFVFYDVLSTASPITYAYSFAYRIHFLVVVALLLEFWLERRRQKDLPWPRLDLRW